MDLVKVDERPRATSLQLLQAVYSNPDVLLAVRMRAAIAALPFEHPKLAVIANLNTRDIGDRLEAQIKYAQMKTIEAQPVGFRRRV